MYDVLKEIYETEELNSKKKELLKFAIEEEIYESEKYKLNKIEKPANLKVDVNTVKIKYPTAFEAIKKIQETTLMEKTRKEIDKLGETITQAEAKKVLNKKEYEEVLVRSGDPTITYEIRIKEVKLNGN